MSVSSYFAQKSQEKSSVMNSAANSLWRMTEMFCREQPTWGGQTETVFPPVEDVWCKQSLNADEMHMQLLQLLFSANCRWPSRDITIYRICWRHPYRAVLEEWRLIPVCVRVAFVCWTAGNHKLQNPPKLTNTRAISVLTDSNDRLTQKRTLISTSSNICAVV